MRAVKAKTLRGKLGFHPGARRDYDHDRPIRKVAIGTNGQPTAYVVTGTIKATGSRRSYQAVKRNRALTAAVLGAQ